MYYISSFIILQWCRKETVPPKYFICRCCRIVQSSILVKHFYLKLLFSGAVAEEDGATFKRQLDRTTFEEFWREKQHVLNIKLEMKIAFGWLDWRHKNSSDEKSPMSENSKASDLTNLTQPNHSFHILNAILLWQAVKSTLNTILNL